MIDLLFRLGAVAAGARSLKAFGAWAQPGQVAEWVQGHWGIANRLHWVRDVTYDEDRSQVRSGNAPAVMAALRNIAITALRLLGWDDIAGAVRHLSRDRQRVAHLLLTN